MPNKKIITAAALAVGVCCIGISSVSFFLGEGMASTAIGIISGSIATVTGGYGFFSLRKNLKSAVVQNQVQRNPQPQETESSEEQNNVTSLNEKDERKDANQPASTVVQGKHGGRVIPHDKTVTIV